MKIALIQIDPTIGDVDGNAARVIEHVARAESLGADLAVFSEQVILGYPAKDLLLRSEIITQNVAALRRIAEKASRIGVVVGFAEPTDRAAGRPLFNSAALLTGGRVAGVSRKRLLPTYDVFDEARYFDTGGPQAVFDFGGRRIGLTICEDMWSAERMLGRPLYDVDPLADLTAAGADLLINISASPYYLQHDAPRSPLWRPKHDLRLELLRGHARRNRVPIAFVNQVGGNDELLFDGCSCVVDARGETIAQGRAFDEDVLIVDLDRPAEARRESLPGGVASLLGALRMGLRGYVRKCGFRSVVVGVSGGIDSAVVAALAVDALGAARVFTVAMPSRYSSAHSLEDARRLAENLGVSLATIPIEPMHAAFESALAPHLAGGEPGVTEENVQARIRGATLMALSNKFGHLLLTTGNKSEFGVGYCTLYGDMCGGLAAISDVPKTMVYELARLMNRTAGRDLIPARTISKAPSAELRPNQTDQDSLPPYDVLDEILERYEERLQSAEEIIAAGFEPAVVRDVVRRVDTSEYKRQQAAPGLKVTSRAFGFGRRMPIARKM